MVSDEQNTPGTDVEDADEAGDEDFEGHSFGTGSEPANHGGGSEPENHGGGSEPENHGGGSEPANHGGGA